MLKIFASLLVFAGWAAWVDAKLEIHIPAVACKPPLKFTSNDKQDACFARCQKNPNCLFVVVDNKATKSTCALVDKSAKCRPRAWRDESYTLIANIDPPKYTVAENVGVSGNRLAPVVDAADWDGFGGPYAVNRETCGNACAIFSGCNGYSYGGGSGHSPATCELKTFTKPVTIGQDAQCGQKNAPGVMAYNMYFAKAEHAPKKKC